MATRNELINQFIAKKIGLDEIVGQIKGAKDAPRMGRDDPDGDPSIGDIAGVKLYGALCAKKITDEEYWAIYNALAA